MRGGWVYMMADRYRGTIYTGVTSDIARGAFQHREGKGSRFVARYSLLRLVYVETYERIDEAIAREKAKWRRQWKIDLIEAPNPNWLDLFEHTANLFSKRPIGSDHGPPAIAPVRGRSGIPAFAGMT